MNERLRALAVPACLGLLAGLAASLHPFTRSIEYPLALVLAGPVSWLGLLTPILTRTQEVTPWRRWRRAWLHPLAFTLAALPAPALASLATHACEPLVGLGFVLLGPAIGGVLAAGVGALLCELPLRRRWLVLLAVLLPLLSILVPVMEFFTGPSVRFYTLFFGYYHGAIYDEAVFIEGAYLWFRLWNLLGLGGLMLGVGLARGHLVVRRWAAPCGLSLLLFVLLAFPALNPGFMRTTTRLDRLMPVTASCEHFEIHTAPTGPARRLAEAACRDLEFRLAGQVERLGVSPSRTYRLYLYDDLRHKRRMMGAGRTSIARPWQAQIHIPASGVGTRLSAHELAHILAGETASGPFAIPTSYGVMPIAGLIEGVAVALEPPRRLVPLETWAAALDRLDLLPPVERLFTPTGFWTLPGGRAYTASGGFIRWLLQERGAACLRTAYGGEPMAAACGDDLETLAAAWRRRLDEIPVPENILEAARFIYDRPSVFDKRCPHAVARTAELAGLCRREQGEEAALPWSRRALAFDPGRQALAGGLALNLAAVGEARDGLAVLDAWERGRELSPMNRAELLLDRADVHLLAGQNGAARKLLGELRTGPAGTLWSGALATRSWLVEDCQPELVRLYLGRGSRAWRRAAAEDLLRSPKPRLSCAALPVLLSDPETEDAITSRIVPCLDRLDAGGARVPRCVLASAGLRRSWIQGETPLSETCLAVLERDCASPVRRMEIIEDWRRRLDWERGRELP